MQFARYYAHGEVAYGVVEDGQVKQITTTPFEDYEVTDHTHTLDEVQLLPPVQPGKVIAIALNYSTHLGERPAPKRVEGFYKPHNCIIADGEDIVLPDGAGRVDRRASSSPSSARPAARSPAMRPSSTFSATPSATTSAPAIADGPEKDMRGARQARRHFRPPRPFISTDITLRLHYPGVREAG